MIDFLKSLIGGRPPAPAIDKTDITEVSLDLKVLDSVDPGLGKRAIAYVLTGEGGSVLLELEQRKAAVTPVLSGYHQQNPNKEGLVARQRVLTRRHGPEASWLRRYGEVLSVLHTGSRWGIGSHQGPSPVWLRSLILGACLGGGGHAQPLQLCADFDAMLGWRDCQENAAVIALDIFVMEIGSHWFSKRLGSNFYDFAKHLPEEYPAVSAAFPGFERPGQCAIIGLLTKLGLVTGPYFDFIYEQYLSSTSKPVREAAQNALLAAPAQRLTERARATLAEGNPTARGMAALLLPMVLKQDAQPILEAHLAKETAKSVRRIIELGLGAAVVSDPAQPAAARTLVEDGPAGYLAADGTEVLAPAVAPLPGPSPVSERVRAGYRKLLERAYDSAVKQYEFQKERYEKATPEQRGKWWRSGAPAPPKPSDPQNADRYCDVLAEAGSLVDHPVLKLDRVQVFAPWGGNAAASAPFNDPEMTLWHLTRAYALHASGRNRGGVDILSGMSALGEAIRARLVDGFDLRTVAALLQPPVASDALIRALLTGGYYGSYFDLPDGGVWPFMCQHFAEIDQAFGLTAAASQEVVSPRVVMERLQAFPNLPARYFVAVLGHAIGEQKSLSAPARALLMTVAGVERRLIPYLEDGKQDVRVGVATMLGSLGAESAVEPLKKALAKEKSDLVRAAFLGALQRLKVDISGYVSPETLIKEATSGLKKAKDIPWFPFAALPALAWSDGGAVSAEIVRWWILLAAKLAQPGGNALFSLWLDQLQPASAEALGRHILASFLSYDATPFPEREANAYAEANAQKNFEYYQDLAKRYNNEHYRSMTYERVFAALRAEKMAIYPNNAYAERGILGLAVRADGAHAVQLVRSYMRDHYTRTSQVRALTEYLGGNPSTATLQLLLSVARRHRTKQVQGLAGQLVERIADERGWTAEELADRTVPTAGLDERGVLDLPIGDRVYEAKLEADDTLVLYNPSGKAVKALPQMSEGPEKAAAAEAKAAFSNAKKELAQVYEFQAKRLYEALCTGRLWPTAEWTQYLLEHPIVGRLVQRLVWLGLDGDRKIVASFRPLADLSLSDAEDQPVAHGDFAKVQLAHGSLLPAEESAKWQQHLGDYKVAPLFAQFGRPLLAGETGTVIADRRGYLIEAFKLRSVTQKLGYDRGAAGDGGWFTEYLKPFPSIGITAVIEFTGSPLPEENREVALTEAKFMATGGKRRALHGSGMALEKVPPVLLSEVWNDLHQVAALGTGFAEDWQKRTSW
ncbi:MAG TPA: DUF4132 domain-containing protein [Xanthobacteraceae bacterium]|nr:DUF4132 domain-containing protein [Xanthobacteraceae bacterium]